MTKENGHTVAMVDVRVINLDGAIYLSRESDLVSVGVVLSRDRTVGFVVWLLDTSPMPNTISLGCSEIYQFHYVMAHAASTLAMIIGKNVFSSQYQLSFPGGVNVRLFAGKNTVDPNLEELYRRCTKVPLWEILAMKGMHSLNIDYPQLTT